jgi:hypothetical protein
MLLIKHRQSLNIITLFHETMVSTSTTVKPISVDILAGQKISNLEKKGVLKEYKSYWEGDTEVFHLLLSDTSILFEENCLDKVVNMLLEVGFPKPIDKILGSGYFDNGLPEESGQVNYPIITFEGNVRLYFFDGLFYHGEKVNYSCWK